MSVVPQSDSRERGGTEEFRTSGVRNGRIVAAGAVVGRKTESGIEVLLVHRPKYDDWSFPKGKLDPHEHMTTAAVREVAEETGIDIRLGPPLSTQTYTIRNGRTREKDVHYWVGRVVGKDDVSRFRPNDEIDEVAWMPLAKARKRLTYVHDRATLDEFEELRRKTRTLIVLRHAKARSRNGWHDDDRERPLTRLGELQADQLVPMLAAYGVGRLVSSSSRRCWTTLSPYADLTGLEIQAETVLSEEGATADEVVGLIDQELGGKRPTVLCTHRPVLPLVWEALDLTSQPMEPASFVVVHHRHGQIVAIERHEAPSGY